MKSKINSSVIFDLLDLNSKNTDWPTGHNQPTVLWPWGGFA